MTDPILKEASKLKKEKGTLEAVKYLSERAQTFPRFSELFFKYYFKSITYSLGDVELFEQVESSLESLIHLLETKNNKDQNYIEACKYLFNYYIRIGNGDKAIVSNNRINTTIYPHSTSYLFDLKENFQRHLLACQLLHINQYKKDIEFIFNTMMCNFLDIAWNLSCDLKFNMQSYYAKFANLNFISFDHFGRLKWNVDWEYIANDEESIYDYFDEKDIEIFKRVFKKKYILTNASLISYFYNYYFELFPSSLNFKSEFLSIDYHNLDTFGKHFKQYIILDSFGNIDLTSFNGLAFSKAIDLAHEFENKYIISNP